MAKLTTEQRLAEMRENARDMTKRKPPETPAPTLRPKPPAPRLDMENQVGADLAAAKRNELNAGRQPPGGKPPREQKTPGGGPPNVKEAFAKAASTTPTKQAFYRAARVQKPKSR
jgi:hypothetical protein